MEREKLLRLEEVERKTLAKIEELEPRVRGLEKAQAQLDADAFRAEILEEAGAKARRAEADKNQASLASAREAAERTRAALPIIAEEKKKLRDSIRAEILAEYQPKYEAALRDFLKALRSAVDVELKMRKVESAATAEAARFLDQAAQSILNPTGPPAFTLINQDGSIGSGPVEFMARAKLNGHDLG